MKIERTMEGGVAVISLGGKLMGGPDADEVRDVIRGCLDDDVKNVLMDLKDVSWVNSTGLGILIASHVTITNAGGNLKLSNVAAKIDQIFIVTKLHTVFETFENKEQGLASF
jgi:anti-sigma B factor antagonist